MEDSMKTAVDEESGWTMYLDDFFAKNNYNKDDDGTDSSSLVSDAASLVLNTNSHHNRTSSFKKRKNKGIPLVDDALEDTASSPVYDLMNQYNRTTKQRDNTAFPLLSQEKGIKSEEDSRSDDLGRENESTELKKRGLCLVPLSMVVNYFG